VVTVNKMDPIIIQGGMGAGVSGWSLARSVSGLGHLGVVSGTALDVILARRLQQGDPDGAVLRALEHFPNQTTVQCILDRYFVAGGKDPSTPFTSVPVHQYPLSPESLALIVVANFVEVFLAKEGHTGMVGINYLYKIQLPMLASIFGAMLAGVDYLLIGAGIPLSIPEVLHQFERGQLACLNLDVEEAVRGESYVCEFDPMAFVAANFFPLIKPKFLPIVSSASLAMMLKRRSKDRVDGFVVESPTAGGHNAPPRGEIQRNLRGEPIYGVRDELDLEKMKSLGLPFWLAGSQATRECLREAQEMGAIGVQVGTAFAFCKESGIDAAIKAKILGLCKSGEVDLLTDPIASPTGFPFKVVSLDGSGSSASVYSSRPRKCDLGFLRHAYRRSSGKIGFRCPAEPVNQYLKKDGNDSDTCGRKCICNGLMATVGLGQIQANDYHEPAILTAGDDVKKLARFLPNGKTSYSASDVVDQLLEKKGTC
jgi:nitronate monooxygenase